MQAKMNSGLPGIENKIFTIKEVSVMLDSDLALLYGVETRRINQAVKRNINRFPERFMFQLNYAEWENLRSQIVTSSFRNDLHLNSQIVPSKQKNKVETENNLRSQIATSSLDYGGRRNLPYVFTEQGVAMLSAVLKSEAAVKVSIHIMAAFVELRKIYNQNAGLFQRLDRVEKKQLEADGHFDRIFNALEKKNNNAEQGIFFNGQIFDAWVFVSGIGNL
jgi:hypothetical protein